MEFYNKYIKYKQKYLKLKNHHGGKLPFVTLEDKKPDYFPFDNINFNYYNDDYSLINNVQDKIEKDYLLNKKFELVKLKLDSNKKSDFNKKNRINNNNIYKLADEQIIISSSDKKFPFHLCLLSKYKILDELYQKHINIIKQKIKYDLYNNEKELYKLSEDTFLKNNAQQVFKNIFSFNRQRKDKIFDINNKYNILLKYSYCNKFLELLKLIYDIQSKIDYKNFVIITTNVQETKRLNDCKFIKILLKNDIFNLEKYIIINIINFFISIDSKLKGNFDKIYDFYNKQQSEQKLAPETEPKTEIELEEKLFQDYNNAIQTYINISDTTLLFKYIIDNEVNFKKDKDKNNELLRQAVLNENMKDKDLKKDLKSLKDHIEDDIKDIKQLLLFNLYVDNKIDIFPKFSHIFYATFIYYRINKPLISYSLFSNLYPINKNNFVSNLLGINNDTLYLLINKSNNELSDNEVMFNSYYNKHPIHSYVGFLIKIETEQISYKCCVENSILEFIKILFWDQRQFEIKLPEENTRTETEPLTSLRDIFNDININLKNQINIQSLYENQEYHNKIHKLFSGRDNILYRKYNSEIASSSEMLSKYNYEIASSIDNFFEMLRIILNFGSRPKLEEYLNNIHKHNSDITNIDITDGTIDIYINLQKLYTIRIGVGHTYLESFDISNILNLIKYEYFNLLINSNTISNYNEINCMDYIKEYKKKLSKNKDDKNFKLYGYLVQLIIIKYPDLTFLINKKIPGYMEIIMLSCYENPKILLNIRDDIKNEIFDKLLENIYQNHKNYKDLIINILYDSPELIKKIPIDYKDFSEVVINRTDEHNYKVVDFLVEKYDTDYLSNLLDDINQKFSDHKNYIYIVIYIIRKSPELIKKISIDSQFYYNIIFESINFDNDCKIADYLIKHPNKETILKKINESYKYNSNYKDLIKCFLRKNPELIEIIPPNHLSYLKIVINSIYLKNGINNALVDYLLNNYKYNDLVKKILNEDPKFIEILIEKKNNNELSEKMKLLIH
jgi:DNA-directed RNA polymerase subunit L